MAFLFVHIAMLSVYDYDVHVCVCVCVCMCNAMCAQLYGGGGWGEMADYVKNCQLSLSCVSIDQF